MAATRGGAGRAAAATRRFTSWSRSRRAWTSGASSKGTAGEKVTRASTSDSAAERGRGAALELGSGGGPERAADGSSGRDAGAADGAGAAAAAGGSTSLLAAGRAPFDGAGAAGTSTAPPSSGASAGESEATRRRRGRSLGTLASKAFLMRVLPPLRRARRPRPSWP